jgi:RNA polymerase sigma-32 factor
MASNTYQNRQIDRSLARAALRAPLLAVETEQELARAWRDRRDEAALHRLTAAHLRLVIAIAARFRAYGLPMSDLVQEGSIGLMQAAARFDPDRLVRFSTYASWWIRAAIQDFILRNWSIVRTGTTATQKSLFFNLRRMRALIREGGQETLSREGREAIARKLRVPVKEVDLMEGRLAASDRSLNARIGEDGDTEWQDLVPDDRPLPEDQVIVKTDTRRRHEWLEAGLQSLSNREIIIIKQRRLRDDGETLEALGRKLGISKERVRQIEQVALQKLKAALLAKVPDPVGTGLVS